jgi:branched-chain amino acid transport system substrate-binding protein
MTQNGPRGRRSASRWLLATAVSASLLLTACGSSDGEDTTEASGGSKAPIKIGVLVGLTGSYATLGESERKSTEIYAERLNSKGGINGRKVELVVADTTSNESEAVNQLRKLVTQDGVIAVMGPSSTGESVAVKPIAASLKVPVLSFASSPAIIADSQWMYKAFPGTLESLKAQLGYVKDKGLKRVALLASNNAYGQEPQQTLPSLVKEFGLELVASELFAPTATDLTPQLGSLAKSNPEATLVWAVNPANAIIAKNAAAIRYPGLLFNSPGGASAEYISLSAGAAEGTLAQGSKMAVVADVPKDDEQYEVIQDFVKAWKAGGQTSPNQFAAIGWDSMSIMETALSKANLEGDVATVRSAVRDSLENNIKGLVLTNTVFDFSKTSHGPTSTTGLAILRVKGNAFVLE